MAFSLNIFRRPAHELMTRRQQPRVVERIKVAHETILIVRKGAVVYPAHVSDITSHGFMVRAEADINTRDLIEIRLPVTGWVVAQVQWTGGADGRLGCKFLTPLSPDNFALCLAELLG